MTKRQPYERLYNAVAVLERRACEDWRASQHPSLTLEEAMALSVRQLETTVTSRPGGNTSVTVSLLCRHLRDCKVEYYSLQRAGNKWYENVRGVSPSTTGIELTIAE